MLRTAAAAAALVTAALAASCSSGETRGPDAGPGAGAAAKPAADTEPVWVEGGPSSSKHEETAAVARAAAADLAASGLFGADVLDVRAVQDRSSAAIPTAEVEEALRRELVAKRLHVLSRGGPKEPERAVVAVPVYGFVDEAWTPQDSASRYHFEAAVEAPGGRGPSRVAWACEVLVKRGPSARASLLWENLERLARDATADLAAKLDFKDAPLAVEPVLDRAGGFPVLGFDAALRARLVRRAVPVVWQRAPGVDAPPALSAGKTPEPRKDVYRLLGEARSGPGGDLVVTFRVERPVKNEIVWAFDRTFPRNAQ